MGDVPRHPVSTPEYGTRFWIAFAVGGAVIAFGVIGMLVDIGVRAGADVAAWLAGVNVVDDLLLAPGACVVGAVLARVLPEPWRAPVRAALLTTAVVLLVAFPALRGYGRDQVPDNDSVDPLNYATATVTVLAAVWAAATAWLIARVVNSVRRRRQPPTRATLRHPRPSPR
jgi:hypothetical protein